MIKKITTFLSSKAQILFSKRIKKILAHIVTFWKVFYLEYKKICNEGLQVIFKAHKRLTDKDDIVNGILFIDLIARLVKYYSINVIVSDDKII